MPYNLTARSLHPEFSIAKCMMPNILKISQFSMTAFIQTQFPTQEQDNSNITFHSYINSLQISDITDGLFRVSRLVASRLISRVFMQTLKLVLNGMESWVSITTAEVLLLHYSPKEEHIDLTLTPLHFSYLCCVPRSAFFCVYVNKRTW